MGKYLDLDDAVGNVCGDVAATELSELRNERDQLRARIAELEAENERLRNALNFYADEARYNGPNARNYGNDPYTLEDAPYMRDVTRDYGEIAREALRELQAEAQRMGLYGEDGK